VESVDVDSSAVDVVGVVDSVDVDSVDVNFVNVDSVDVDVVNVDVVDLPERRALRVVPEEDVCVVSTGEADREKPFHCQLL
jgi:hypothetical protein